MRIGIIATTIVMIAVLAVITAIATAQLGVFDGEPDDASTRQRSEPTPDIPDLVAAAVAAQLPGDQAQPNNPPLGPSAELVGLITEPRGPVFTELGQRIRLDALGVYSDGTSRPLADDAKIVFTSSAPEFVSIDPDGLMVAAGNGGADITATYGGFTTQAPAVVFLPMQDIPPFDPELVHFADEDGSAVILNRIIVHTKNEYHHATSERIAARHNATVVADFANMDAFLVETETSTIEDLEAILNQLKDDPDVDEAFADGFILGAQGQTPETAKLSGRSLRAYGEVQLPAVWEILNSLPNSMYSHVNVGVIDTGMYSHECKYKPPGATNIMDILEHEYPSNKKSVDPLSPVLVHKKSCFDELDQIAHGTAVVSILAAANNSTSGPGGVGFNGILAGVVDLPYRIFFYRSSPTSLEKLEFWRHILDKRLGQFRTENERNQLQYSEFYAAMGNMDNSPIRVINVSANCKYGKKCEGFKKPVEKFARNNPKTLIVLSAGNEGDERGTWPDIPHNVMVVGGMNSASCYINPLSVFGGRHSQSNHGTDITIAAPYCVYTMVPANLAGCDAGYNVCFGTSFSAPLVSGTAALLFSIDSTLTGAGVKDILVGTGGSPFCPNASKGCTSNGARQLDAKKAVCETLMESGVLKEEVVKQAEALCLNRPTGTSATSAPNATTPRPLQTFPAGPVGGDYDHDNDGLIEVRTLDQLYAIHADADGDSFLDTPVKKVRWPAYLAAFPDALDNMGCPADGCIGYELAGHLDFDTNGNGKADAGDAYWNDGAGWGPLSWAATFDGNGYTIANLYIDRPDPGYVGLFASNVGIIRNVFLVGVDVTDSGAPFKNRQSGNRQYAIGSLVGYNDGIITDSAASGTVSGISLLGGLVGYNKGTITNSSASGTVSGHPTWGGRVGGLVADNNGPITNSAASSMVSGHNNVGGLVGHNSSIEGTITNSRASGTVSGSDRVGGLVGAGHAAISESKVNSTVTGNDYVGGLVGGNNADIGGSTASGTVSGNDYVGGLVGYNYVGHSITNSMASSTVSGNDRVGGLVGNNGSAISGSTASGTVSGNNYVGGLIGVNGSPISGSTASGTVSGNDYVGGLVGHNSNRIRGSAAEGDATGQFYVGGLVGLNDEYGWIVHCTASGDVAGVGDLGDLVGADESGGDITNCTAKGTVTTRR